MVYRDSREGERDVMLGLRWRALVLLRRDQMGIEFAEEEVAFLDPVPRHNVVLMHRIEVTRFP